MPRYVTFIASLMLVVAACGSVGELPVAKLESLASDIEQASRSHPSAAPAMPQGHDLIEAAVATLRASIAHANVSECELALQQLSVVVRSEPLRTRCRELAAEIGKLREAHDKQLATEVDSALGRAVEAVRSAKKPADLDATLQELGKLRANRSDYSASRGDSHASYRIDPAIDFVTKWQNYLAQSAAGNAKAAQATLDHVIAMDRGALLPRSEILARRYAAPSAPQPSATPLPHGEYFADNLEDLKTPDDLVPLMAKLMELANDPHAVSDTDRPALQGLITRLTPLTNAYKEFQAGLPTKIELVLTDPTRAEPFGMITASVRAQLIKLMLPRYLGLPPEVKAKAEEGAQEFLERIARDAVAHEDFVLAARARETQRLLREGKSDVSAEKSQASLFVTAHNQELAQQYALAVCSYEQALASGADIVPPKVIGERLAKIKVEHPSEYQSGLENYLTPRMPALPPGFSFGGPGGSFPGYASGPPNRRPAPSPVAALVVPAASVTPVASTSTPAQKP